MEDFDKNNYINIIQKYTDRQIIFEMAILKKQEANLYIKKKALEDEFKRRLEEK